MTITNPAQLVAEYKKSGEFDRLRREILSDFQRSEAVRPLLSRVEDIARQKLQADRKLEYLPQEAVHRELIAELDRYPVVERAVGEFRARSERLYPSEVRAGLKNLLRETQKREIKDEAVMKVDEPTKPPAVVVTNVGPPAPTEDVKVGDIKKNGDGDPMDVEQTPNPKLQLTETTRHANDSTSADRKEMEDGSPPRTLKYHS